MAFRYSTLLLALLPVSCGGGDRTGSAGVPCEDFSAVATPAELGDTPRDDEELEYLALAASTGFTADGRVYQEVRRDVPAIRAAFPEVSAIRYARPVVPPLALGVDRETFDRMRSGSYDAWGCLNRFFGLVEVSFEQPGSSPWVHLEFDGVYRLERLAELYRELPGVEYASPNGPAGSRPSPQICAAVEPDANRYAFIETLRCPECTSGGQEGWFDVFSLFVVEPGAAPRLESTWDSRTANERPGWVETYAACQRGLTY